MKLYITVVVAFITMLTTLPIVGVARGSSKTEGEIIASIPFDPKVNGFGFRNYGKNPDFEEEDLTADDLIRLFGAANVCIEGTTAKDCELYETANRWIEQMISMAEGGHCDGFSAASLRMFMGRPFKGRKDPSAFQSSAENLFDLKKDQATSNFITYHHTLQSLKEVSQFRMETFKKKPSEILAMMVASMETKKDLYTLGIGMRIDGKYTRGHSIVPFAVEDIGDDNFRIHVYDNNYPGETKYVYMNTKNETWRYHTASDPSKTANDYVGSASTQTMSLKRMSDRFRARFGCSFCDEDEGGDDAKIDAPSSSPFMYASYTLNPAVTAKPRAPKEETLTITTSGDVDLLITDPMGKRIGYDVAKKVTVNEITGAVMSVLDSDDTDQDVSPQYTLPVNPANKKPYKINLHGTDSKYMSDLQISGAGFVVGFEDISVDKGESLNMTFTQDGRELTFTASADGETPSLYISTDSGKTKPSYDFEIGGITLAPGKTVSIKLDLEKGFLYFKDDDGDPDKYDVRIVRMNPNGKADEFDDSDMDVGKDNNYVINFGTWDGKGAMCVKDDADETKLDKGECHNLNSDKPAVKKPKH